MLENLFNFSFQARAIGALVALVILGHVVRSQIKARSRLPLPPGPPGHWLFGNSLPKERHVQVLLFSRHYLRVFQPNSAFCKVDGPIWTRYLPPPRAQGNGHYWALPGTVL